MSRKPVAAVNVHNAEPRPTGLCSMCTRTNFVLLIITLAAAGAVAYTQIQPAAPETPIAKTPSVPDAPAPAISAPATPPPPPDRVSLLAPTSVTPTPLQATWEGVAPGQTLPLFITNPPHPGLAPAPEGVRVPVNSIDLFTSKPTGLASPKTTYKGYTIAFCCDKSSGYNGGWEHLTEAEKDTYVRSFLK